MSEEYKKGHYYWAIPVYDVDTTKENDWYVNKVQPALCLGGDNWLWIGLDEDDKWPAKWVGNEIIGSVWINPTKALKQYPDNHFWVKYSNGDIEQCWSSKGKYWAYAYQEGIKHDLPLFAVEPLNIEKIKAVELINRPTQ